MYLPSFDSMVEKPFRLAPILAAGIVTAVDYILAHAHIYEDANVSAMTLGILWFSGMMIILVDMFVGLATKIRKRGDAQQINGYLPRFISKMIGLSLYYVISVLVLSVISNAYFVRFAIYIPFMLLLFNEYSSIGRSLEKIVGHKPYIFRLFDKVTDIVERGYLAFIKHKIEEVVDSGGDNLENKDAYEGVRDNT